jgi:aspartyl-tRNA(Asn)/glutamyl-tRNA(Gln) amidotransferase subunit A
MNELTELTICEAAKLLSTRSISSVELVEATLKKIEETDPIVHAYTRVLAEDARKAALQADQDIIRGNQRGILHGIPIAVKDNIYTKGIPTEAGSKVMAGFIPEYDATVVQRLSVEGAILIGKTICHEFAVGVNEPPTRNPYNLACYPGGSSAGSGVSVAVRSAYGSIGSDTGGSIRIPATMVGIVGLKPTYGRVSGYGVFPLAWSLDHVGPLTRTVEDCALLLQAIAGYDPNDPFSIDQPVQDFRADLQSGVKGIRIGVERSYFFYDGVIDDVRTAVESVIAEYEQQGAEIVDVSIPELNFTVETLLTIMLSEAGAYHQGKLKEHSFEYDPATRNMLEVGQLIPATHYLTAQRARSKFREAMANTFKTNRLDAMLWPTIPLPTVPLNELALERQDKAGETPMQSYIHHTFSANLTGQPAISVPCGFTRTGLPIGFQLIGRPFDEASLFRIAQAYEQTNSWAKVIPSLPLQKSRK